jgi:drug/metabolite transporter (DMT)-like permease
MPRHVLSTAVLSSVVGLGVVCTALAFVVFFALIAEVGPVRATVITYVNPAVALGLGVILLHEPLTAGVLLGFALILVGSVVTNRPDPRARPAEPFTGTETEAPVIAAAPPAAGK